MTLRQLGFSLIELVIVMVLLAVLGIGVSNYITIGTDLYAGVAGRDRIISSARFAIERLNRDLRNALPNSPRLANSDTCLEFIPVIASTSYLTLPVTPISSNAVSMVEPANFSFEAGQKAAVYVLDATTAHAGGQEIKAINSYASAAGDTASIGFSGNVSFPQESPGKRIYIIKDSVSYCVTGSKLTRNGVIMAENIVASGNPFQVAEPTLSRNAVVKINLKFSRDGENLEFNHAIHINNVP